MKWFKSKSEKESELGLYIDNTKEQENIKLCQVDQGLSECIGVAKIRNLQIELKNINAISVNELINIIYESKYDSISAFKSYVNFAFGLVVDSLKKNRELSDQFLSTFKELLDKENRIQELEHMIREEKNKLGIE